jgi:hypothetical protein
MLSDQEDERDEGDEGHEGDAVGSGGCEPLEEGIYARFGRIKNGNKILNDSNKGDLKWLNPCLTALCWV